MKKYCLALASALVAGTLSTASVAGDWTPYLKGIQGDCGAMHSVKIYDMLWRRTPIIPKHLKADVIKHTYSRSEDVEDDERGTVKLKNAYAFGQPITEINVMDDGIHASFISIKFANKDFDKALKDFFVSTIYWSLPDKKKRIYFNQEFKDLASISLHYRYHEDFQRKWIKRPYSQLMQYFPNNGGWVEVEKDFYAMEYIHKNGYKLGGEGSYIELDMDRKTKTITCTLWMI